MLNRVLGALQYKSYRKAVAEISNQEVGVESSIKHAVDDALTTGMRQTALQVAKDVPLT